MANHIYSLLGNGGLPYCTELSRRAGMFVASGPAKELKRYVCEANRNGFVICADNSAPAYRNFGLVCDLPTDSFELLLHATVISVGVNNYIGTGVNLFLAENKETSAANSGYQVGLGSGRSNNESAIILRNAQGASNILGRNVISSLISGEIYFRVRRQGASLSLRVWDADTDEPSDWDVDVVSTQLEVSHVFLQNYSAGYNVSHHRLAVATNGDTASFSDDPVQVVSGQADAMSADRMVEIVDANLGYCIDVGFTDENGGWSIPIYESVPVYARIHAAQGPVVDAVFARGSGYLAGSYPDGITTIDGVPSPATIRVLLRTEKGHPSDGCIVAEVQSKQDGTWRVDGLNPELRFDVVGRSDGFNDVIVANVQPEVD